MLQAIQQADYGRFAGRVESAIHAVVPKFGFSPPEVEAVIREHALLGTNWLLVIDTGNNQAAFCVLGKRSSGWTLHSLIPSDWQERHEILRRALPQILTAFKQDAAPGSVLHFGLNEDTPTHQFYFAALLPDFGFELRPRISMAAELEHLTATPLPTLPPDVRARDFDEHRIAEYADCLAAGFAGLPGDRSPATWRAELLEYRDQPDTVHSWVGIEQNNRIVGACLGRVHGDTAVIYELTVLPALRGRGLGRFLLLRCAQRLREYGGDSCRRCALWTFRTLDNALALYYRLGFRREQLWTEAIFTAR